MGGIVTVVEVDPIRALEAAMDGYRVTTASVAAEVGEIFIAATGNLNVWGAADFPKMRDGAILANAGHFNDEFELSALESQAASSREVRPFTREYLMADGRRIFLLADGRLVNLGAAEGHPALVMDMSFANQALGLEWLRSHAGELEPKVYGIPEEIDREVARLKLSPHGDRDRPDDGGAEGVQRVLGVRHRAVAAGCDRPPGMTVVLDVQRSSSRPTDFWCAVLGFSGAAAGHPVHRAAPRRPRGPSRPHLILQQVPGGQGRSRTGPTWTSSCPISRRGARSATSRSARACSRRSRTASARTAGT